MSTPVHFVVGQSWSGEWWWYDVGKVSRVYSGGGEYIYIHVYI